MTDVLATNRLKRLQDLRGPRDRRSIYSEAINRVQRNSRRVHRSLGDFIECWEQLLPREVARHTIVKSMRGGTISVSARSSAIAFEVDRLLREGLLAELRASCSSAVVNVRVHVGSSPAAA